MNIPRDFYDSFLPIHQNVRKLLNHTVLIATELSNTELLVKVEEVIHTEVFTNYIDLNQLSLDSAKIRRATVVLVYSQDVSKSMRTVQQIREQFTEFDLPVIVILDSDDVALQIKLIDAGADDFLILPFEDLILKARVCNKLEQAQLFRSLKIEQERASELARFTSIRDRIKTFTRSMTKNLSEIEFIQTKLASLLISKNASQDAGIYCQKAVQECGKIRTIVEAMRLLSDDRFLQPPKISFQDLPNVLQALAQRDDAKASIQVELSLSPKEAAKENVPVNVIRICLYMLESAEQKASEPSASISLEISYDLGSNDLRIKCDSKQAILDANDKQAITQRITQEARRLGFQASSFQISFTNDFWSTTFHHSMGA